MTEPNYIAGYIVDPNKPLYLLLRRSQNSFLPGIWQIVTGKLDLNESASDAVKREITEETSLPLSSLYNVDVTMFYEQTKNQIAFSANFCAFCNHLLRVILSASEHDAYQWVTFSKAMELLPFPAQKETAPKNLIISIYD